jgi:methylated-DNA-protein-cysteine methyltransferase related protein
VARDVTIKPAFAEVGPLKTGDAESTHGRIHKVVARIPRGRVATYGQIARLAGLGRQARLVGYAMHALPAGTRVPWQRVINAQGAISLPGKSAIRQRKLLEREGVRFDARGRVDLDRFLWQPRSRPETST